MLYFFITLSASHFSNTYIYIYTDIDSYLMGGKQVIYTGQQSHVVLAEKLILLCI